MQKTNKILRQEEGFASITIALTMIIVLALLVVGFAQLARREQQSALDKQLSAQAYYAAETGINDVRKLIDDKAIEGITNVNTSECLELSDQQKNVNTAAGVSYTCAIVNLSPKELKFQGLQKDASKFNNFQTTNSDGAPVTLSSLRIKWDSDVSSPSLPSGEPFLSLDQWISSRYPSVIQFALTPYNASGASRDALTANTGTTYLYPGSTASSPVFNSFIGTGAGKISKAGCTGNSCSITISGIESVANANNYLLHLINMYVKSDVVITGKDTAGEDVHFKGAQAMVDVTGKARNVLKRLQVRIPLDDTKNLPAYVLEAQNICKRINAVPSSSGSTTFNTSGLAGTATDKASCNVSAN